MASGTRNPLANLWSLSLAKLSICSSSDVTTPANLFLLVARTSQQLVVKFISPRNPTENREVSRDGMKNGVFSTACGSYNLMGEDCQFKTSISPESGQLHENKRLTVQVRLIDLMPAMSGPSEFSYLT